jgi:hypothetical protein
VTGGCPFHSSSGDSGDDEGEDADDGAAEGAPPDGSRRRGRPTVGRRAFARSALLVGGAGALGSLERLAGVTPTARAAGSDPVGAGERLNRQHAWDAVEPTAASGNSAQPPHSLVLMLDYVGDGEPSPGHRREVEAALTGIERQFAWHPDGVLFTIGYSAGYFDRFEADPPAGAAPDAQETVVETVVDLTDLADTNTDATVPDRYDAVLLLASANEANLLATEAALWGDDDLDVSFEGTFEGVFERPDGWPDRRVGFAGPAFQEREAEYEAQFLDGEDAVPDESPLSMGFVAGFGESVPGEEVVTLRRGQRFPGPDVDAAAVPDLPYVGEVGTRDPGVFAQGTLKHLSYLELDLAAWYGEDGGDGAEDGDDQRRHQMYSPYHGEAETEARGGDRPGSGLTDPDADDPNRVAPDADAYDVPAYADRTPETAAGETSAEAETGQPTVGHSQKTARARYDVDGTGPEQPVLRRDWDAIASVEGDREAAGYVFNVPMRFNESIYTLLDATYNVAFTSLDGRTEHEAVDAEGLADRNGIAPYMTATRRGNWLVPPITVRALPYPRAADASLSVRRADGQYLVTVSREDRAGGRLDPDTARFGSPERVNRARGVAAAGVSSRGGTTTFAFPVDGTGLSGGDTARFVAKTRGTRRPVAGETSL